ncbi:MAG: ArnT family glycosyltransferase [Terriglobales bacterium]
MNSDNRYRTIVRRVILSFIVASWLASARLVVLTIRTPPQGPKHIQRFSSLRPSLPPGSRICWASPLRNEDDAEDLFSAQYALAPHVVSLDPPCTFFLDVEGKIRRNPPVTGRDRRTWQASSMNALWIILLISCAWALGVSICVLFWPATRESRASVVLKAAIGAGIGFGIAACLMVSLLLAGAAERAFRAADLLAVLAATFILIRWLRNRPSLTAGTPDRVTVSTSRLLLVSFVLVAILCLGAFVFASAVNPHGNADAWQTWNLRARFLFRGFSGDWRSGFDLANYWSHPDYPLLLPGAVAHLWFYLRTDSTLVPILLAATFAMATVTVLFAATAVCGSRTRAFTAGLLLLGTPFFTVCAASQYADVPLCFFILSAIVLVHLARDMNSMGLMALSGLSAAFAAWTKNEGLLFFVCLAISLALVRQPERSGRLRRVAAYAAGAAPVLVLLLYFKFQVATPTDLFAGPYALMGDVGGDPSLRHELLDLSRYAFIFARFVRGLLTFGAAVIPPIPLLVAGCAAIAFTVGNAGHRLLSKALRCAPPALISISALSLTLTGYAAVYVISPMDLKWHLDTSLTRLLLHLWPAALFVFFTSSALDEGTETAPHSARPMPAKSQVNDAAAVRGA